MFSCANQMHLSCVCKSTRESSFLARRFMLHLFILIVLLVPSFSIRSSFLTTRTSSRLGSLVSFDITKILLRDNIYLETPVKGNSSYTENDLGGYGFGRVFRWKFDTEMKQCSVDDYIEFLNRRYIYLNEEENELKYDHSRSDFRKWFTRSSRDYDHPSGKIFTLQILGLKALTIKRQEAFSSNGLSQTKPFRLGNTLLFAITTRIQELCRFLTLKRRAIRYQFKRSNLIFFKMTRRG